jgi:hypothetical protein
MVPARDARGRPCWTVGGLFSLVFAFVYGRAGRSSPTSNIRQIRLRSETLRRTGKS